MGRDVSPAALCASVSGPVSSVCIRLNIQNNGACPFNKNAAICNPLSTGTECKPAAVFHIPHWSVLLYFSHSDKTENWRLMCEQVMYSFHSDIRRKCRKCVQVKWPWSCVCIILMHSYINLIIIQYNSWGRWIQHRNTKNLERLCKECHLLLLKPSICAPAGFIPPWMFCNLLFIQGKVTPTASYSSSHTYTHIRKWLSTHTALLCSASHPQSETRRVWRKLCGQVLLVNHRRSW